MCGFLAIGGVFASTMMGVMAMQSDSVLGGGMGVFMVILYIGMSLLYFFPCLFLYKFSSNLKMALDSVNEDDLTTALDYLRKHYKFIGIVTIVVMTFYGLAFFITLLGAAFS